MTRQMKVTCSVQARLGSTRLPGKVLLHLGNRRLLQRTIDKVNKANFIDEIVTAIGNRPENDAVIEYCERNNIKYIVGPEDDLLSRHLSVIDQTGANILVRITADCPFIPPDEVDRIIKEHLDNSSQYTTNLTENMPTGTAVDVIDANLLTKLKSLGESHPVKLLRSNPEKWNIVRSENPSWRSVSEVHLAVDTPDDYWSLTDAVEAVGSDSYDIAKWLNENG